LLGREHVVELEGRVPGRQHRVVPHRRRRHPQGYVPPDNGHQRQPERHQDRQEARRNCRGMLAMG
jgi:hypothetical protein